MKIQVDTKFQQELLDQIRKREFKERVGVHSSDLIYCLNKQALRKLEPIIESDAQLLLYSLGWATQRWLTGRQVDEAEVEVDRIKVTPDCLLDGVPWELKATFQANTHPIEDSPAYVRQVMAQCYVTKSLSAKLSRLEIMGNWKWVYHPSKPETIKALIAEFGENWEDHPTLTAWSFEFTQDELDRFWAWMCERRDQYLKILETKQLLPKSLTVAKGQEFECDYCPYKEKCNDAQGKLA